MYVALTRARERVYLLTDARRRSVFIEELAGAEYADWVRS
jgi:superfamily I DNA/RNA helicase